MLPEETKSLLELSKTLFTSSEGISPKELEKAFLCSFIWHFNEKRSWSDESIKKQAIKVEIKKLEKLVNGNAIDKDANYYLNQFNQYLFFNFSENSVLQLELISFLKREQFKVTFKSLRDFIKTVSKSEYKNPQAVIKVTEREANDLDKIDYSNIEDRLNNILSGYKSKHDERAEPFYKSLLCFKDYLEDYGKPGNEIADGRFKSNLSNGEIASYFSRLTIINNSETKFKGLPILSTEELKTFLYSNFRNFSPPCHKIPMNANCSNASLTRLFYEYTELESKIERTSPAVFHKMLKDNFLNYKHTELKTIKKEFARTRPVHYSFK